mmetsp:Transcript_28395/g.39626  ORF Transcript_28395/g.39626 Transcript_28395/m.39626 type:complete len:217 (+) Transcript_28395:1-651(+)
MEMDARAKKTKKKKRRVAAKINIFDDEKQHISSSRSSNSTKKRRLRTRKEKIKLLDDEGTSLAEKGAYGQAIGKWNQALQMSLDADDEANLKAVLHEQCSQVYLEMGRAYDAVVQAHKAVENDSTFVHGYVSLARAQLNLGEPYMALSTMQKAILLDPTTPALWKEFHELKEISDRGKKLGNTHCRPLACSNCYDRSINHHSQPIDKPNMCTDNSI